MEKNGYGCHDQKSPINTFFDYKNCSTIVITVRLAYLNDYKEEYIYLTIITIRCIDGRKISLLLVVATVTFSSV